MVAENKDDTWYVSLKKNELVKAVLSINIENSEYLMVRNEDVGRKEIQEVAGIKYVGVIWKKDRSSSQEMDNRIKLTQELPIVHSKF